MCVEAALWFPLSVLNSVPPVLTSRSRPASAASIASVLVTERLAELVVLFKERTEVRRERLVDPDESDDESACEYCCSRLLYGWCLDADNDIGWNGSFLFSNFYKIVFFACMFEVEVLKFFIVA